MDLEVSEPIGVGASVVDLTSIPRSSKALERVHVLDTLISSSGEDSDNGETTRRNEEISSSQVRRITHSFFKDSVFAKKGTKDGQEGKRGTKGSRTSPQSDYDTSPSRTSIKVRMLIPALRPSRQFWRLFSVASII